MVNSKIGILLKKQIKFVCDTEMKSLKPGNVHKFSEGPGMNVKDFFKSSLIISKCLTKNNLDLGKKILNSVNEIQNKIKKNKQYKNLIFCTYKDFSKVIYKLKGKNSFQKKQIFKSTH
mgnify:CR=1 FL=1